jgi:hypothetical protein
MTCAWAPVCVDLLPCDDLTRELRGTLSVCEYLALRQQGVATVDDLADADIEALLTSPYADETSQQRGRARCRPGRSRTNSNQCCRVCHTPSGIQFLGRWEGPAQPPCARSQASDSERVQS